MPNRPPSAFEWCMHIDRWGVLHVVSALLSWAVIIVQAQPSLKWRGHTAPFPRLAMYSSLTEMPPCTQTYAVVFCHAMNILSPHAYQILSKRLPARCPPSPSYKNFTPPPPPPPLRRRPPRPIAASPPRVEVARLTCPGYQRRF